VKVKQVSHMRVVSCLCLWNNMIILLFYGCCVCVIAMIISNVSLQWLFPTCHCNDYFQRQQLKDDYINSTLEIYSHMLCWHLYEQSLLMNFCLLFQQFTNQQTLIGVIVPTWIN
jgi:hypothetical protein